jgi:hypothetical protein
MMPTFLQPLRPVYLIVLVFLLLFSGSDIVSQTRVQTATGNTGTSTSATFTISLGSAPINGNTLIAVISGRTTTQNNVTSISANGSTWVQAVSIANSVNSNTEIWYTTSLSGAGTVITINQGSARSAAVIMEYSGLLYATPIDQIASNSNGSNSTAASTGITAATTTGTELWIGAIGLRNSGYTLSSITNGFSTVTSAASAHPTAGNNACIYALEKTVSTTGTATTGGTVSTSSLWSGAIATFKASLISGFSPIASCKGSNAVITIDGLGFTSSSIVAFNGTSASTTFVSSSQLTAILPGNATSGFVTVTTGDVVLTSSVPFLAKATPIPTADITNTTCSSSTDGAIAPNNIPNAINFDYTKSQYVNLGSSLLNGLGAFTIEGWIKTTTYNRNSIFGQDNAIELGFASDGTIELWSEGLSTNLYTPSAFPTDGQWHHVAGVGNGNNMSIFIDGVQVATRGHNTTSNYGSSDRTANIGGFVWDVSSPNYFNGQILKVGFWNRALTPIEIANIASSPHGYSGSDNGLIAGYNFYEGTGTALSKTPGGTNGTFSGSPVSSWSDLFTYSWTKSGGGFTATNKSINTIPTGTYNLAATFNGCTSNSENFVVASNGAESTTATSISEASPICAGTQVQLSVVGGSLGTAAAWNWYTGSCGGSFIGTGTSINVTPSSTTTYYVRAEGTCNTTACVSFTVNVNAAGTWLGTTNTDWNTASNWCGGIPTLGTDVIIPSTALNQPIIGDADGICNSLTINSGATVTISGSNTLTVHGNWINNGTFTANTSTVIFNGTTAISGATTTTFNNLTINSEKSITASADTINITGNWTNNGTFSDNSGTISFTGSSEQTINGVSSFNNLTISNSIGVTANNNITIDGELNLNAANPSATVGLLDMATVYNVNDVLTSSNNLIMSEGSTTTGIGDVTGRIIRNNILPEVTYTFGNSNATMSFYGAVVDSMPTQIKIIPRIGVRHLKKDNTVKRYYQIIRTGGGGTTKFTLKLPYLTTELDTITESRLVFWDHHIAYATVSPHEHGKTLLNTSENYITLGGHGIRYLVKNEYSRELAYVDDVTTPQSQEKIWMISGKESINENTWLGAANTNWNTASNWTAGSVPTSTSNVFIPANANRILTIIEDENIQAKSITIEAGATVITGTNSTIELFGGLADNDGTASWINTGTFTPSTSTVIFKDANAAISGTTDFYNITIPADSLLILLNGSVTRISGVFDKSGTLDAIYDGHTTVEYNGSSQAVVNPVDGYYNLILSGSGTKTLPSSSLNILGDLTTDAAISATGNTIIMNGASAQTISGTVSATFNNLTVDNSAGVTISNNETVNGTLTLTSGLVTTGSNVLTLGCDASTSGQSDLSYVNGKLARVYCSEASKIYPIGKGGNYRPLTLEYTTFTYDSELPVAPGEIYSTVLAEQFESEIAGSIPNYTTYQTNRHWNLIEIAGIADGNYTLTLNGSPFTTDATSKILRGDGTTNTTLSATYDTPDFASASVTDNVFGNFAVASECLPPTFNTHPSAASSCELNGTPQFTVSASGTLTYQWQVSTTGTGGTYADISNGGVYSNATTATLSITEPPYSMNGYAYRAAVIRDCGGSSTSEGAVLTVNPQPQGSLTANEICKNETGFLTWTASVGTGPFTVVYNAGAGDVTVNNVESATPFSIGILDASKTYNLVSVSNTSCTRTFDFTSGSATVTVKPYITWTGTANTDWNTASNWCGGIPTINDDVLIPVVTNKPVISNNPTATTNKLIIEGGSSVTISGEYTLDVRGNLTNNGRLNLNIGELLFDSQNLYIENNGLIDTKNTSATPIPNIGSYGGAVKFSGASQQTLFGGTFKDITVENPNGVVVAANAVVNASGVLEIKTGAKLFIGTGRSVTANSVINSAGASGLLIKSSVDAPNGTLIFRNTPESPVQATVEMYSKAFYDPNGPTGSKYKWQFFGVPVRSMPISPAFDGSYLRKFNEGGWYSGSLETNHWINLQNGATLTAFASYEVTRSAAKTYTFSGELVNSSFDSDTLAYTSLAQYPGQHLIGNPYTAAINISDIQFGTDNEAVIENSVYLYSTGSLDDWTLAGSGAAANEDNSIAGQYIVVPKNIANRGLGIPSQIPSMQAFLVKVKKADDLGWVKISYPANEAATSLLKNTTLQRAPSALLPSTRIDVKGASFGDRMWIFTEPGCSRAFDNGWDGYKTFGTSAAPQLFAREASGYYQVNSIDNIHNTELGFIAGTDTDYAFTFTHQNIEATYPTLYLFDSYTGEYTDIAVSGSQYSFTSTNALATESRFKIVTEIDQTTEISGMANTGLKVSNSRNSIVIRNTTPSSGTLELFDLSGRMIYASSFGAESTTAIPIAIAVGSYIAKAHTKINKITVPIILH